MERTHKSPWLAVSVGIAGMIVGYTLFLAQTDRLHFATANHCPSHDISRHAV